MARVIGLCIHAAKRQRYRSLCAASGRSLGQRIRRDAAGSLDAAIIYATVGDLVPLTPKAVRKGGRVVCAGIHTSDISSFTYALLRATNCIGRQSNAVGRTRFPAPGIGDRHCHADNTLPPKPGEYSPRRSPRGSVRRCCRSGALSPDGRSARERRQANLLGVAAFEAFTFGITRWKRKCTTQVRQTRTIE